MKKVMKPRILGNNVTTIYTFENVSLSCALVSRRTFIPQLAKKGVGTSGMEYERNSTQHRLFTTPPSPMRKAQRGHTSKHPASPSQLQRTILCQPMLCLLQPVDVTVRVKSSIVPKRERYAANILLVAQKKYYFVVWVPCVQF